LHLLPLPLHASGLEPAATQGDDLPDRRPPITLPKRPKPTPETEPVRGGHIELHIAPAADIWTEVEWQGGDGSWHVVQGWRGYATRQGTVRWYVAQSDLKKGPYRWQIYLYEGGELLASGEPFYLPSENGQRTSIEMKVPALAVYLN